MSVCRNGEYYPDPTAGEAFANIARNRKSEADRVVRELRQLAKISGFQIMGRVALHDGLTGKVYR